MKGDKVTVNVINYIKKTMASNNKILEELVQNITRPSTIQEEEKLGSTDEAWKYI